ncbi:MAG TPA: hypothetical protein DDZ42_18330 [Candidatus Rokubacteria bacterium]|nr:hypothetical protein [Candidatus Rokubacteria bacterium]
MCRFWMSEFPGPTSTWLQEPLVWPTIPAGIWRMRYSSRAAPLRGSRIPNVADRYCVSAYSAMRPTCCT